MCAMKKADITIGQRAAELVYAHGNGRIAKEARRIGIDRKSVFYWNNGIAPSAYALQAMAFAGYDIYYILTGHKATENSAIDSPLDNQ